MCSLRACLADSRASAVAATQVVQGEIRRLGVNDFAQLRKLGPSGFLRHSSRPREAYQLHQQVFQCNKLQPRRSRLIFLFCINLPHDGIWALLRFREYLG